MKGSKKILILVVSLVLLFVGYQVISFGIGAYQFYQDVSVLGKGFYNMAQTLETGDPSNLGDNELMIVENTLQEALDEAQAKGESTEEIALVLEEVQQFREQLNGKEKLSPEDWQNITERVKSLEQKFNENQNETID